MLLFRRTTPLTRSTEEARACRGLKTPSSRARPQTPTPRASRAVSRAVVSDATLLRFTPTARLFVLYMYLPRGTDAVREVPTAGTVRTVGQYGTVEQARCSTIVDETILLLFFSGGPFCKTSSEEDKSCASRLSFVSLRYYSERER